MKKVSICMIVYNHEKYLREAIESVISQNTSFLYELVIGEDGSSDNSREICMEYSLKFPNIINLLPAQDNQGMMKNFLKTYSVCHGKYIAFLEGDDYWTDPLKLQKQVDFLDAHPSYSTCFHNVKMKVERNNENREWILHQSLSKDSFNTEDILGPWFIPSLSIVFRNYSDFVFPSWFSSCKYGDLPMMLLLSLRGDFKYCDEVMGVYRLHDTGLTTKDMGYDKVILMIYIYECFNIHTNYKFKEKVREAMIYEIDRHVPKPVLNDANEMKNAKPGLFQRGFRKMKQIVQNTL